MSDVTTINHNYTATVNFRKLSFFLEKVFICNDSNLEKNLFCIDLSKYRLITNILEFFAYDPFFKFQTFQNL